jgi:hypothetical protein
MQSTIALDTVPDDELLRRLDDLLRHSRGTEADVVAHIGEVGARRLYAREASSSMYAYCTEVLHFSEAEAYLRIAAARASREHPAVLEMLADGRLHLSAVAKLAPHLTPVNRDDLLRRATHKSKREVEELLAELEPRPDVPSSIRKLPEREIGNLLFLARHVAETPSTTAAPLLVDQGAPGELSLVRPRTSELELRPGKDASNASSGLAAPKDAPLSPGGSEPDHEVRHSALRASRPATIEPLAPARYRVQFTASAELRDKLERLRALMRSSVPDGDLAAIIDGAVTEKLERLEARRFGSPHRRKKPIENPGVSPQSGRVPPKSAEDDVGPDRPPSREAAPNPATPDVQPAAEPASARARASRYIPAAVRREVYERDGGRCHYANDQGRRCGSREGIHFHHRHTFAFGGGHSVENLGLACSVHNRHLAEVDYGRKAMARYRRSRHGVLKLTP